jgi:hypothetical protein
VEQLFDRRVPQSPPLKPPELSDTPFTFVQDRKTLNKLVRKLKNATEFAVSSCTSSISKFSCFPLHTNDLCFCLCLTTPVLV